MNTNPASTATPGSHARGQEYGSVVLANCGTTLGSPSTTKARLLDLVAELESAGVEVESSSYVVGTKGDLYSIWARWGSGRILLRTAKQVREHVARLAV